jgi:hypothetical protein
MSPTDLLEQAQGADASGDHEGAFELASQAAERAVAERNEYQFDVAFHRLLDHAARLRASRRGESLTPRTWSATDPPTARSGDALPSAVKETVVGAASRRAEPAPLFVAQHPRPPFTSGLIAGVILALASVPAAMIVGAFVGGDVAMAVTMCGMLGMAGLIVVGTLARAAVAAYRRRGAFFALYPHMVFEMDEAGTLHAVPLAGRRQWTLTETKDSAAIGATRTVALFGATQVLPDWLVSGDGLAPANLGLGSGRAFSFRLQGVGRTVEMRLRGTSDGEVTMWFDRVRAGMARLVAMRDVDKLALVDPMFDTRSKSA